MSHRTPFPPSPGLPPTLYSGMSSLQINQAGPASIAGDPVHAHRSQPQKALLKAPKTARHQSRKGEYPSSSAPWKDPRQAAAVSSGHMRTVKDDVSFKRTQAIWSPFPPDARPTTHKERDIMLRAATDHVLETRAAGNKMYEERYGDAERRVSELEALWALRLRTAQHIEDTNRDRERYMQGPLLELLATAPNEEMRQQYQKTLDMYRRWQREEEGLQRAHEVL